MVVQDVHEIATKGFSDQVDAYEAGRPSYPPEAIKVALDDFRLNGRGRVLDVGAGNGKFTRLLAANSQLQVEAVEPNEGMRAGFAKLQSQWGAQPVPLHDGSATSLPFPDATFDAVFIAQAFHWMATEAALRELARVLKPGGGLALIWNREDDTVPWQAELLALFEPLSISVPQYWQGTWREAFANDFARHALGVQDVEQHRQFFRWTNTMTPEMLWARLLSRSYIASGGQQVQDQVRQGLSDLLQRHRNILHERTAEQLLAAGPALQGASKVIDVVLRTELFLCKRQL